MTTVPATRPRAGLGKHAQRVLRQAFYAGVGFLGLLVVWELVTTVAPDLPTPSETLGVVRDLLSSPLHSNGENDKGVAINLGVSLRHVLSGFTLAMLVAVPVGFLMGISERIWAAVNPIVQFLRPVSPLAWLPICLVIFRAGETAAIGTIFVTALWPTLLNTAFGVANVPQDHRNVARVFKFSRYKYVRHVLLPHSLPAIITGMRISMGVAWLVIVAVEMLIGSGIGFYVWDSYNAGNNAQIIAAIVFIGAVGLVLDTIFTRLLKRVSYVENV
jgi:nitrate/nitrite transport system permease protein